MKHLMKFEGLFDTEYSNKYYWCVPTEDGKLPIALKKIGAPQKYIDKLNSHIKILPPYIYVGEYLDEGSWAWDDITKNFEEDRSIYMCQIEVDESEVSANKYNL